MKVGILGCGEVSRIHVKALLESGKCRVVSVCDLNKDRALALANRYRIPKVYTDFSKMLKEEKLDIVHVLTPPQVHAPLAIEAMEAGCNVLVEKPMCMTVQEADQMIEAAKRNNVKLGVVHSFLFTPAIRKALAIVEKGEIGDLVWVDTLVSIKSLLEWKNAPGFPKWYSDFPGGLFGEIIPHGLYIQLAFLGKVKKVVAFATKREKPSKLVPFSELQAVMDCENALGGLLMSTRMMTSHTIILVRVIGSRRILLINVPSASLISMKLRNSTGILARASTNVEPAVQLLLSSASLATKKLVGSVEREMTHKIIIEGFIESVQKGSRPPVTPEDGREVVRATNMVWKNILT